MLSGYAARRLRYMNNSFTSFLLGGNSKRVKSYYNIISILLHLYMLIIIILCGKKKINLFQKTLKHTRYGRISVKCYYDAPEQRLTVEILHAADIIALDANGKSVTVKY